MKKTLLALVAAAALAGCLKTDEPDFSCKPENYNECGLKAPAAEIDSVKKYLAQQSITAVEHCSGLFYVIDSMGTGVSPTVCDSVSIRYKGMLTNGRVFDSSNASTAYWPLRKLVRGWVNGLSKIKPGGGMRLYIPPTLGYGGEPQKDQNHNVIIPAHSILVFEVKLDGIRNH